MLPLLNRPNFLLIGIFNSLQLEMQLSQEKLTHKLNIYVTLKRILSGQGVLSEIFRKLGQYKVFIRNDYVKCLKLFFNFSQN